MGNGRSLGNIIRRIRREREWTLADLSGVCGIPVSTLSKIENDRLTLTYDKLQEFSRALSLPLGELFSDARPRESLGAGRRSIASLDRALKIETPNYIYHYLCSDLRNRRMIPVQTEITAKTLEAFGDLVRHPGEEFSSVLEGAIVFHSEFYEPVTLSQGEGVYIDSNMGHAYIVAEGHERAVLLSVCSSDDENFQEKLMAEAESRIDSSDLRHAAEIRPVERQAKKASTQGEKVGGIGSTRPLQHELARRSPKRSPRNSQPS